MVPVVFDSWKCSVKWRGSEDTGARCHITRQIDSPGSHFDQPEEAMPHEVQKCACDGTGLPQLEQNDDVCVPGSVATCCGGTDLAALNALTFVPICP